MIDPMPEPHTAPDIVLRDSVRVPWFQFIGCFRHAARGAGWDLYRVEQVITEAVSIGEDKGRPFLKSYVTGGRGRIVADGRWWKSTV